MPGTALAVQQNVTIVPPENPRIRTAYDTQQHQNGR